MKEDLHVYYSKNRKLIRTRRGATSHHIPAWKGYVDIFKNLLANCRVDICSRTNKGLNVLHYAAEFGHVEIVRLILEDGRVDPLIETYKGFTLTLLPGNACDQAK
jgi:ankyrin repeat protein